MGDKRGERGGRKSRNREEKVEGGRQDTERKKGEIGYKRRRDGEQKKKKMKKERRGECLCKCVWEGEEKEEKRDNFNFNGVKRLDKKLNIKHIS